MAALRDSFDRSKRATTRVARTSRTRIWRGKYRGIFRASFCIRPRLRVGLKDRRFSWKTSLARREDVSKAQLQNLRVGLTVFFSLTAIAPEKRNFKTRKRSLMQKGFDRRIKGFPYRRPRLRALKLRFSGALGVMEKKNVNPTRKF